MAVIGSNLNGTIVSWNRAAEILYGYTAAEAIGRDISLIESPDDGGSTHPIIDRIKRGEVVERFEAERVRKDGSSVLVAVSPSPICDRDGRIVGVSNLARDISAEKRAERMLREAEERYRQIVETAREGIITIDTDAVITFANETAAAMLGTSVASMIGTSIFRFMREEAQEETRRNLKLRREGVSGRYELMYTKEDGSDLWVQVSASALLSADGTYLGSLGLLTDLTESKKAAEAIERRDAILEAVAYAARRFLVDGWRDALPDVLARLSTAAGADRARAFHLHGESRALADLLFEWTADGIPGLEDPAAFKDFPFKEAGFTRWYDTLVAGGVITGDVADMPEVERRFLEPMGVKSLLEIPVRGEDVEWGMIGFDAITAPRTWSQAEIDALRAAGDILGASINREAAEAARDESEERFRQVIENINEVFWLLDVETGEVLYTSPRWEALAGSTIPPGPGGAAAWLAAVHPDDRAGLARNFNALGSSPARSTEYRIVRPDGTVRWVRGQTSVVTQEGGKARRIAGILEDITERRRLLEETVASHERLIETFETIADGFVKFDPEGRIAYMNPRAEELLGVEPNGALGKRIRDFPDVANFPKTSESMRAELERGESLEFEWFWVERDRWLEIKVYPSEAGPFAYVRDVSERKRAEDEIRRSYELLRRADDERRTLITRLVHAQEEERSRIAGDIHDDSIQALSAQLLRLYTLRTQLSDPTQLAVVDGVTKTTQAAIARLRTLIFELHPASLDREGLAAALRASLERSKGEGGTDYSIEDALTSEPPMESRATIFRIAQEAINNVRKHARATKIEVRLESRDGGVHALIRDDGVGMNLDDATLAKSMHMGLVSMRERAAIAGGWCKVDSTVGVDTTVEIWIPDVAQKAAS